MKMKLTSVFVTSVALLLGACNNTPPGPSSQQAAALSTVQAFKAHSEVTPITFVGRVENSSAYIAVVDRAGVVEVYVCDGTPDAVKISEWYEGAFDGATLRAQGRDDSSLKVTGSSNGDMIAGSVHLSDGSVKAFTVVKGEEGGVYTAMQNVGEDATGRTTWIALRDGTLRGSVKTFKPNRSTTPTGPVKPRFELGPIKSVADELRGCPVDRCSAQCELAYDEILKDIQELVTAANSGDDDLISDALGALDVRLDMWNNYPNGVAGWYQPGSCSEQTGVTAPEI
jgi:hypothetical protein